jgi:hypothetical protein
MSADLAESGETIRLSISWRLAFEILHVMYIKDNQMLVFNFTFETTRYGMGGPGNESQWGRDFLHLSRRAMGFHPNSYTMGTGSLSSG